MHELKLRVVARADTDPNYCRISSDDHSRVEGHATARLSLQRVLLCYTIRDKPVRSVNYVCLRRITQVSLSKLLAL